jgi:hypothetical protein
MSLRKLAAALACTGGIVFEPHNPIQVPGHRALMWLTLLVAVRLVCGPGWSSAVGLASIAGSMALVHSPHGLWTVAQYGVAGIGVDAVMTTWPSLAEGPLRLMALGAAVELSVGWIAPLGQSLFGGVGMTTIWQSLQTVGGAALVRLFSLDILFGAGAGLLGWSLVALAFRRRPTPASGRHGMIGAPA